MKLSVVTLGTVLLVTLLATQSASAIRVGLCRRLTRRQRQLASRDDFPTATCNVPTINREIKTWCTLGACGPLSRQRCKTLIRAQLRDVTFPANCDSIATCAPQSCTTTSCRSSVDSRLAYPANCPEKCAVTGGCAQTFCSPEIPTCAANEVVDETTCTCKSTGPPAVCSRDGQCPDVNLCRPGVCTDEGQCETFTRNNCCVNDQNGRVVDSQCTSTAPVCGGSSNALVGLGARGTTCYFCEDDRGASGVDNGCTSTSPFCASVSGMNVGTDGLGDACFSCQSSTAVTDTNCQSNTPICGLITGIPAATGDFGNACFKCINDGDGIDTGCSGNTPTCDAPAGRLGTTCTVCRNTMTGSGVDFGCSADRPICSTSAGADIAANLEGNECFKCLGTVLAGSLSDLGCTATKPNCASGDQCAFCLKEGALPDFGCGGNTGLCGLADGTPLVNDGDEGTKCFACENTSKDVDPGCSVGVCVAGEGELGSSCAVCQNDRGSDAVADLGCTGAEKKCGFSNGTAVPINGFGNTCIA